MDKFPDWADEHDRHVLAVVDALAKIINRASMAKDTSAAAVKVVTVPVALLYQAGKALEGFEGCEYETDEARQARHRVY